jgi:hypothetical protein
MVRIVHIHWYKFHHQRGVYAYFECRCGERKANKNATAHGVLDRHWLNGGEDWNRPPIRIPSKRHAALRRNGATICRF